MARHETASTCAVPRDRLMLKPMPFALLDEPLEYMVVDHFRHRSLCAALKRYAASGKVPRMEADMAIAFLDRDLIWHHEDEDQDLFPLLRQRLMPEDELGVTLARLGDDHRNGQSMVQHIVSALAERPAANPVRLDTSTCDVIRAYVTSEHRHLAIENGIVFAIARIRLRRSDLASLSRAMKARRGA